MSIFLRSYTRDRSNWKVIEEQVIIKSYKKRRGDETIVVKRDQMLALVSQSSNLQQNRDCLRERVLELFVSWTWGIAKVSAR